MTVETPLAESRQPDFDGVVVPHAVTRAQRILAWFIYFAIWLCSATLRYRWAKDPRQLREDGRPYIFCVWHNRLPLSMVTYQGFVKAWNAPFRMAAMVSASRDGALTARVLELFRVEPARGSSSRRGSRALLELTTWAERGYDLALTVDGPRGPRYEIKPGVVALAQLTGRPVVLVSYSLSRKIILKSWDRFQIPLPFSMCEFDYCDPVSVPRESTDGERERIRAKMESRLRKLTVD